MKQQNNIEKEAPVLFGLEKKQNLATSENYFKELPIELNEIAKIKNKSISFNKNWIIGIALAASIIIGAFILIPTKHETSQEIIAYNSTFNNLTAEDFEVIMLSDESDFFMTNINFDDAEELQFLASELQSPLQETQITEKDFENYFESEIEFY